MEMAKQIEDSHRIIKFLCILEEEAELDMWTSHKDYLNTDIGKLFTDRKYTNKGNNSTQIGGNNSTQKEETTQHKQWEQLHVRKGGNNSTQTGGANLHRQGKQLYINRETTLLRQGEQLHNAGKQFLCVDHIIT